MAEEQPVERLTELRAGAERVRELAQALLDALKTLGLYQQHQGLGAMTGNVAERASAVIAEVQTLEKALQHDIFAVIRRRFDPDRRFEEDGFIITTKLIEGALYITWENTNKHIFTKRRFGKSPNSIGTLAGNVYGYRGTDSRRNEIIDTKEQKGQILDTAISYGITMHYRFFSYKIVEIQATSDLDTSSTHSDCSAPKYDRYLVERKKYEKFRQHITEIAEEATPVEICFDVWIPQKK